MNEQWRALALCAGFPNLPWIGDPTRRSLAAECAMTAVCQACPVHEDCSAYAQRHGVTAGFWAGRERGQAKEEAA